MIDLFLDNVSEQVRDTFLVFLRVGPAIALAPGYGETAVPARVRLMLGLFFSFAISPWVQSALPSEFDNTAEFAQFALRETLIGSFFGIIARGTIFLIEKAGAVISQTASLAQMLGNASQPMPVMSHILMVAGLALIFATPISDAILLSFISSYTLDFASLDRPASYYAEHAKDLINYVFNQGVTLSMGFVSLFFVYYLLSGFINKAMPQFMVTFIGIPLVALCSIVFMYKHFDLVLSVWQENAMTILMMPFED